MYVKEVFSGLNPENKPEARLFENKYKYSEMLVEKEIAHEGLTQLHVVSSMHERKTMMAALSDGFIAMPGGSQGNLCLGGQIGRYVGPGQIQNSGTAGEISLLLALGATPTPSGLVAVQPGETWNFQCWFRDAVGGQATSNFTNGVEIVFQ